MPRAGEIARWERPNPTLREVRSLYRSDMSDEELLLRFMTSDVEVEAMLASGPLRTRRDSSGVQMLRHVARLADQTSGRTSILLSAPGLSVSVRKRPDRNPAAAPDNA